MQTKKTPKTQISIRSGGYFFEAMFSEKLDSHTKKCGKGSTLKVTSFRFASDNWGKSYKMFINDPYSLKRMLVFWHRRTIHWINQSKYISTKNIALRISDPLPPYMILDIPAKREIFNQDSHWQNRNLISTCGKTEKKYREKRKAKVLERGWKDFFLTSYLFS